MRTERADITQVLNQMRAMREQAQQLSSHTVSGLSTDTVRVSGTNKTDNGFGGLLKNALNGVNAVQQDANNLARAYELGDSSVDLTRVMIASQKASISFQAAMQVRNKLVTAYQDIMNMPI